MKNRVIIYEGNVEGFVHRNHNPGSSNVEVREITSFNFDHLNDEDFKKNSTRHISGEFKFTMNGAGALSKVDLDDIEKSAKGRKYFLEKTKEAINDMMFFEKLLIEWPGIPVQRRNQLLTKITECRTLAAENFGKFWSS